MGMCWPSVAFDTRGPFLGLEIFSSLGFYGMVVLASFQLLMLCLL